jgi:integrase
MKPCSLPQAVNRYLDYRIQFGFQMARERIYLRSLVAFGQTHHHTGALTVKLALAWAQQAGTSPHALQHARRLDIVRRFARFWVTFDPRTEVPPVGVLGPSYGPRPPVHIYTPRQMTQLLTMTHRLHRSHPWWARTIKVIVGLLATTGARLGEVVYLQDADIDWSGGTLRLRHTKSGRPRWLPLHATTLQTLRRYRQARRRQARGTPATFFVQPNGTPLAIWQVKDAFRRLRQLLGWQDWKPRPRLHGLRHTFAVGCLSRWQGARPSLHNRILVLATYLGHRRVVDTYWYCSAIPSLMKQTQRRWQQHLRKGGRAYAK